MDIAQQLKDARLDHGYSQNEIASKLHITRQSISKWENGRNIPDLDNLIILSEVFGISLDELVKGDQQIIKKLSSNRNFYEYSKVGLIVLAVALVFTIITTVCMNLAITPMRKPFMVYMPLMVLIVIPFISLMIVVIREYRKINLFSRIALIIAFSCTLSGLLTLAAIIFFHSEPFSF